MHLLKERKNAAGTALDGQTFLNTRLHAAFDQHAIGKSSLGKSGDRFSRAIAGLAKDKERLSIVSAGTQKPFHIQIIQRNEPGAMKMDRGELWPGANIEQLGGELLLQPLLKLPGSDGNIGMDNFVFHSIII
jgi:hypothetical protein